MEFDDIARVYQENGKTICLLKDPTPPYYCKAVEFEGKKAKEFLKWYKAGICAREDPEERWEHFEVLNKHGVFDGDKLEALLKLRSN